MLVQQRGGELLILPTVGAQQYPRQAAQGALLGLELRSIPFHPAS